MYFLLPLTYVYICVIAVINYILMKNVIKAIKTIIIGFLIAVVFFLLLPVALNIIGLPDILNSKFFIIYFYIVSTLSGVYIIKEQEKYIKQHEK